ncbi:MAG TPA: TadE family protein, partial [Chloroflexota bacterium]|nr:TadE family protein [Chloroflexota bacterium]
MWGRAASLHVRFRLDRIERASALVEAALVIPLLMVLVYGVIGVSKLEQTVMAVSDVSREAARSAALADNAGQAASDGQARGQQVAGGYGLSNGSLKLVVDAGSFDRGGTITAQASYKVDLSYL